MPLPRLALVFAVLTLLMGGLALFFGIQLSQTKAALANTRQQVLERDRMLFRQERARQHDLTDVVPADGNGLPDSVRVEPPAAAVFADELGAITGEQISNLMKAGLPADPEAFLRRDLATKSLALFTDSWRITDVRILSENAALVALEGTGGAITSLLQFRITEPGRVTWRVTVHDIDGFRQEP